MGRGGEQLRSGGRQAHAAGDPDRCPRGTPRAAGALEKCLFLTGAAVRRCLEAAWPGTSKV